MLALDQPADQQVADERLVAAFCAGLISQLDAPDGLVTLDQELQAAEFVSQPGGTATTDRLVQGDRIAAARAKSDAQDTAASQASGPRTRSARSSATRGTRSSWRSGRSSTPSASTSRRTRTPPDTAQLTPRNLTVAAPSWLFPADPVVTLRAVNRSLRHGYDGRFATDGTLACRVSGQERTQFAGLVARRRAGRAARQRRAAARMR